MKTIYISLPITGHEDTYEQRLDEAVAWCKQNVVTTKQDDVVTPMDLAFQTSTEIFEPTYIDYLTADLRFIMEDADIVVFCEGWQDSRGCRLEHAVAQEFGKKIIYKE